MTSVRSASRLNFLKENPIVIGIGYFVILIFLAFGVRDIPTEPDTLHFSLDQMMKTSSLGDPVSFATAAKDIAETGWVTAQNEWIISLWPPGFILTEGLILKLFGPEASVVFILQILAAALFAVVLYLLFNFLKQLTLFWLAAVLPMVVFAFPVSRIFLLHPTGISLGESFSIGFFIIGFFYAIQSINKKSTLRAVSAGFFLALSAYYRSQFEIFLVVMTAVGAFCAVIFLKTKFKNLVPQPFRVQFIRTMVVTLVVAHSVMLPWRIYHKKYHGSFKWVYTSEITFRNAVMPTEHFEKINASFVSDGAGNLVCRIDQGACGNVENAKSLFIKTFLQNPLTWYSFKTDIIGKYWFAPVGNWANVSGETQALDLFFNGLVLTALLLILTLLFMKKVRRHFSWPILVWFNVSLLGSYWAIFTVQQFEVRYFFFPKIFIVLMCLLLVCLRWLSLDDGNASQKS